MMVPQDHPALHRESPGQTIALQSVPASKVEGVCEEAKLGWEEQPETNCQEEGRQSPKMRGPGLGLEGAAERKGSTAAPNCWTYSHQDYTRVSPTLTQGRAGSSRQD